MASLLPSIPLEFLRPDKKYQLMNWLVRLGLPNRITRQVLESWGAEMHVEITSTDFDLLNQHSLITPHRRI